MKKKQSLPLMILLTLCILLIVSCGGKEPEYGIHRNGNKISIVLPNFGGATELSAEVFDPAVISGYTIIRPDYCEDDTVSAALHIRNSFKDMGIDLPLASDWVKTGTEAPTDTLEILIGETNRPESPAYRTLRNGDFLIKFENNRLVLCGGSAAATLKAAECFIESFVDPETGDILIPKSGEYLCRIGTPADSFTLNGIELCEWELVKNAYDTQSAMILLEEFVTETTHFSPAKESENKIIINENAPDGTCTVSVDGNTVYISASADVDSSMAVRFFITQISKNAGYDPKKLTQTVSADISGELRMSTEDFKAQEPYILYVSPDGDDQADGSEASPLATIDGARLRVKDVMRFTTQPVTVEFLAGDYYISESVSFELSDSGNIIAPITYRAAEGAEVNFIGGLKVDPSLVTKAKDQSIIDRVIDKDAASKLMQIDLGALIDEYPNEYSYGNSDNNESSAIQVYINENPLDYSRWPNAGNSDSYERAGLMTQNEDGSKTFAFTEKTSDRMDKWSNDAASDLYMMTYFAYEWTNTVHKAENIDLNGHKVTFDGSLQYWDYYDGGGRYYFFNLPEEIDVPGESYIDRVNRIIYFLPDDDYDVNEIYVSTMVDSMIVLDNAKNLIFDGINFTYTRGNIISGTGVDNITVSSSTLAHTSSNAITIDGTRVSIVGNHIFDTARGGITIRGGDRMNLISSENLIENNEIHDINRAEYPYNPGIYVYAIGTQIRHNKLYNAVHMMICISTNDVIIEYNEIFNCALEAADMGAIYTGRNPSMMGNVIRYNYFHQNGNRHTATGTGQMSIYNDDGNNGLLIYGNVFWQGNLNMADIFNHGSQFSKMTGNIFIDSPVAFWQNPWTGNSKNGTSERWFLWLYDRWGDTDYGIDDKLMSVNFDSELWREHYKDTIWAQLYDYIDSERIAEYQKLSDEEMQKLAVEYAPKNTNVLTGNVMVNLGTGMGKPYADNYGATMVCENNYITLETDLFVDYGTDFTLTPEALAEIRKIIPDFEEIAFDKIGLLN